MNAPRSVIVLGFGLLMGAGQTVCAEQETQDSVYKWGRWAVLSPAAGGGEPYVAALEPDAANNARPGEASEFQPTVILQNNLPPHTARCGPDRSTGNQFTATTTARRIAGEPRILTRLAKMPLGIAPFRSCVAAGTMDLVLW